MSQQPDPILSVEGLCIAARDGTRIVDDVGFRLGVGQIGALVGQSGSGKTSIGRAILRLLSPGLAITGGAIRFDGHDLATATPALMRTLRGRRIAAVFQEPMVSLNPSLTVGRQMMEALLRHERITQRDARDRCLDMLRRVRIADPVHCFGEYPGRFSGGMRQRFMLASVLTTRPALLIADEPTTALDAVIRKEIMDQMVELTRELGTSVLIVSHDLAMLSQYSDIATVLHQGRVVEQGDTRDILLRPRTDYMRGFVAALPRRPDVVPDAAAPVPLAAVRGLGVDFRLKRRGPFSPRRTLRAVKDVSFDIAKGEVVAVVGESGSGKTTIGRALVGLNSVATGSFARADGPRLTAGGGEWRMPGVQMVFQDQHSSLDPQMTLEQIVAEPLRHDRSMNAAQRLRRARDLLAEVGLPDGFAGRYAHELSGGQRQRVGIARAVVARPSLIVADEPVSALDVAVQRQVLDLLMRMRDAYGLSYLFISHDLSVVEEIADRVLVMYRGRIVESGPRDAIFDRPHHPYTRRLLEATPRIFRGGGGSYALAVPPTIAVPAPAGHAYHEPAEGDDDAPLRMISIDGRHQVLCRELN